MGRGFESLWAHERIGFGISFILWWVWRSWLARQIVALEAEGSSPSIHLARSKASGDVPEHILTNGLSPSGKAQDFDSCISLVRIQLAQFEADASWDSISY